jgi:hypothetical protein
MGDIKMDLRETGCESVYWFHLAQHEVPQWALVKMAMNLCIP